MNNVIDQHANCLWMALFMAVGIHLFFWIARPVVRRLLETWGVKFPRDMVTWVDEIERDSTESIRADLYAAQCRAILAEKIGKTPADFDPTLLYAMQISAGVHRAATMEAERAGVIRAGTYRKLFGVSIDSEVAEEAFDSDPFAQEREESVPVLDEVRRRRGIREERALARRGESREDAFSADPFAERPVMSRREKRERPAVPCGWSDGKLVPIGRGRKASSV